MNWMKSKVESARRPRQCEMSTGAWKVRFDLAFWAGLTPVGAAGHQSAYNHIGRAVVLGCCRFYLSYSVVLLATQT